MLAMMMSPHHDVARVMQRCRPNGTVNECVRNRWSRGLKWLLLSRGRLVVLRADDRLLLGRHLRFFSLLSCSSLGLHMRLFAFADGLIAH